MNKKKYILSLAIFTVFLLSCQKEERTIGDEVIVFRTEDNWGDDDAETKGTQKTAFVNGDKMGVYAFWSGSGSITGGSKYFENQQVNYNGSAWSYTPAHYYPVGGALYFRAYSPYGTLSNGISLSPASDGLTINYSTPASIADHPDLMASSVDNRSTGDVSFTFSHILSAIKFTTETSGLTVTGVTFTGVAMSGSYDYSAWSNLSSAEKTFTYTAGQCLMIIPQTFESASTAKMTVSYTKDSTPGTCEVSLAGTTWTAGGSYAYKLSD